MFLKKSATSKIELGIPIIGIGNITVGGTGKTPFTIWLGKFLTGRNLKPGIFTTGYKASSKKATGINHQDKFGDETLEISNELKNIPVISGRNRAANINKFKGKNLDLAILDDAYQQWGIKKCLDILLIDSTLPFGNYLTLPAGILREPLSSIKRADIIILTHVSEVSPEKINEISIILRKRLTKDVPIFHSSHIIEKFHNNSGRTIELNEVGEQNIITVTGIANPYSFNKILKDLGCRILKSFIFPDHHPYSEENLEVINHYADSKEVSFIITTQKDFVKINKLKGVPENLIYSRLNLKIDDEPKLQEIILSKL
ncbi:tetraacyldisaccharide 4'-kinase [Candidatus Dependentiae bacterium]|nr:tetraacyldisaccharide 4'-kinase [Candidatus Dependentiae bacterium]